MSDSTNNIKVAVRVRNLIPREQDSTIYWESVDSDTICQIPPESKFSYDRVFNGHENNFKVYEEFCKPIIKSVLQGFNGTIFAYGQTSSGKTFTIMGDRLNLGIAHYTVEDLFEGIQNMPEREFLLRVSCMDIYNEQVLDLFSNSTENLTINKDAYGNTKVHNLTETIIQEPGQVLELMKKAQKKRKTGKTKMNDASSRSHFIFRMIVESRLKDEENAAVNVSQFNLVDLAGSEKTSLSDHKGETFKEGVKINLSLSTLKKVISQLSSKKEGQTHINFRDSKLTRILENSLGGNALTAIICNITPASLDETLSTLRFANGAKKIQNKPKVNEIQTEQALLKQYANRIKKLSEELEATKEEKNIEAKIRREMQQQIQNLKKKFVSHVAPGKSRATRRETWGGCLDMARLRFSSNQTSSQDDNDLFSHKKQFRKEVFNSDSQLPVLEEEPEDIDFLENMEVVTSGYKRSTLSKQSMVSVASEYLKVEDVAVQTDFPSPFKINEKENLKSRLSELQESYNELQSFTALEKQIFIAEAKEILSKEKQTDLYEKVEQENIKNAENNTIIKLENCKESENNIHLLDKLQVAMDTQTSFSENIAYGDSKDTQTSFREIAHSDSKDTQTSFQEVTDSKDTQTSFQEIAHSDSKDAQTSFHEVTDSKDTQTSFVQCDINFKRISDLQDDCSLKEKQISLIKDKVHIQEQIIKGLEDQLALKNAAETCTKVIDLQKCQSVINSATQTYYLNTSSLDSSTQSIDFRESHEIVDEKEVNDLAFMNTQFQSNLQETTEILNESNKLRCSDIIDKHDQNNIFKVTSSYVEPERFQNVLKEILKELHMLNQDTINIMEGNMHKAYFSEIMNESSKNLETISLDTIKLEVESLRKKLQRIEFYVVDQSESAEHFKNNLSAQMGELSSLKRELSDLEMNYNKKDNELKCVHKLLSNAKTDIVDRILLKSETSYSEELNLENPLSNDINDLLTAMQILTESIQAKDEIIASLKGSNDFKLTQSTQTLENYSDIKIETKKLGEENCCLKLKIQELDEYVKLKEKKISEIEEVSQKKLENSLHIYKENERNWKIQMKEFVENIEKKHEQELNNQEKEYTDLIDNYQNKLKEMRDLNQAEIIRLTEELQKQTTRYEDQIVHLKEKYSKINSGLNEDIKNINEEKFKLQQEIREYKAREYEITQSYYKLKNKFKNYVEDVKIKFRKEKPLHDKEIQTEHLAKIHDQRETCKNCILLQQKIVNLESQVKIEKSNSKNVVCDLEGKIKSLEDNNENMNREIKNLNEDLASKYALLRTCVCRKNPQCEIPMSTKSQVPTIGNKQKGAGCVCNSKDLLQHEVVKKAIQDAKDEAWAVFNRGEGEPSNMKCLLLQRKLHKKEKELEELRMKDLLDKKTSAYSENKAIKKDDKLGIKKNQPKNKASIENKNPSEHQDPLIKMYSAELGLDKFHTPHVDPIKFVNQGARPKAIQKNILAEKNKPVPTQSVPQSKKDEDEKIEQQLELLYDPGIPSECQQQ